MIILRQVQLTVIELPGVMKYVNALCKDARKQFKDEIDSLTDTTLEKRFVNQLKKLNSSTYCQKLTGADLSL
jgi:mRNA-degrading endonuclease RelE of RelBE toxin-antitoxin system